ncbi:MAG: response regulator [Patescibacteria group bacterium]|jgi:DNA-binding response OmpR family regulator
MPKKIFIVEDDANMLFSLQAKLRVAGFEVIISQGDETEERVVEKVKSFLPDYLILDLVLPQTEGFKILSLLKSSRGLPNLPVFVFTNLSDSESREKAARLGAVQFINKNEFNIDDFIEKIKKIVSNFEKTKC